MATGLPARPPDSAGPWPPALIGPIRHCGHAATTVLSSVQGRGVESWRDIGEGCLEPLTGACSLQHQPGDGTGNGAWGLSARLQREIWSLSPLQSWPRPLCVAGEAPRAWLSQGAGTGEPRGPQRVRLQPESLWRVRTVGVACGFRPGLRPPAAPGAGAGAPSDPSLGLPLGSWVRGPGPPLTRGARAEKEGLSSAAAAPRRKGPAFSGMFSVHFLTPFPLCEL